MNSMNLCYGCMQEMKNQETICPSCGYNNEAEIESPFFLKPGTLLEKKYLVGRVLGQGGFGITYLAYDTNLNIKLAIKEYFPQDLASRAFGQTQVSAYTGNLGSQYEYGLEKFLQEARTLAQFEEHPNIVSVRDFFKANGTAYFVMSYVEGITLKEYLANSGGKLPVDKARSIMLPVMDALKEVHTVNVLHRDVSPDNIFINLKGQVILIDFGAARQAIGEKGHSLSIILKPGYAPEEQYRSKGVQGAWTDIYAVAATYYHLLVGQQPPESLERMVHDDIALPSKTGVEISENEENALMKALAVKASDRYQSIVDFQAGLLGRVEAEKFSPRKDSTAVLSDQADSIGFFSKITKSALIGLGTAAFAGIMFLALWSGGIIGGNDSSVLNTDGIVVSQVPVANQVGNTSGNIFNRGLASLQGNTIYFRSNDGGSLYEADLDSGELKMISTDSVLFTNVSGESIYYCNEDDSGRIYRIGTDGAGRVPVTSIGASHLFLVEDWLYFIGIDDSQIYRGSARGGDLQLIIDESTKTIFVNDEWIYFVSNKDNNLYRTNDEGSVLEKIIDSPICCPSLDNGWIFFADYSEGSKLSKIRTDGSDKQVLTDHRVSYVNTAEGWVYYAAVDEEFALNRIRSDGTERTILINGPVKDINIVDNWIIYINQADNDQIYKSDLEGNNQGLVETLK